MTELLTFIAGAVAMLCIGILSATSHPNADPNREPEKKEPDE